ncbi:MAG: hypothetical protein LLG05_06575 [Porphyromonadaceae bacterium]|nr:hypothetical protein [Porphyromonadaceae bacterium]
MEELIYLISCVAIIELFAIAYLLCELSEIIGQRKIHNEKYDAMESNLSGYEELKAAHSRKNQKRINGRFAK